MSMSLVKKAYRTIVPQNIRQKIWDLRHARHHSVSPPHKSESVRNSPKIPPGTNCDVCKSRQIVIFDNPAVSSIPFDFFRCRSCDFVFVHPKPDPIKTYADYEVVKIAEAPWNKHYLEAIEKYCKSKGRILEIGFGDAGFLELAHRAGWEVHGIEISTSCCRHASEQLALPNIKQGTLESVDFAQEVFDVVAAYNFIEHVPDLEKTLDQLEGILRPGGLLVLLCPNIGGLYHRMIPELFGTKDPLNITWVPPYHVSYFNKQNFRMLLERKGFTVLADESSGTNLLWWQHATTYGPEVMEKNLQSLLDEIKTSGTQPGEERLAQHWPKIVDHLRKRQVWALVQDMIPLEKAVGAECAILYIAQKSART